MSRVRITPKDLERFTEGDCDILAHELHKLTGWPLYTLHEGMRTPCLHAFVLAPGKIAVDIKGARPISHLVREWGAVGYLRGIWELEPGEVYRGSRRRARKVAPHLAAMVAT